jgi:hypothetical protein
MNVANQVAKPDRLVHLKAFCADHHGTTLARRLTETEFDEVVAFVEENVELGHLEFEYAVNRMHLNLEKKPKNWAIIQEILMSANARAFMRR